MFFRQRPIGEYIVDFFCPKAMLVLEVDGGRHFTLEAKGNDKVRDQCMRSFELTVLRFTNSEVLKNTDKVILNICEYLKTKQQNPPLSSLKREDEPGVAVGKQ